MTPEKKSDRIALLTEIGSQVHEDLLKKHESDGGDPHEIVFRADKIPALVEEYSSILEEYRAKHIEPGKMVEGDKIAAFTSHLIMRHWIFESQTGNVSTVHSSLANETFGARVVELFVKKKRFGLNPPELKMLIYCLANGGACRDCLQTWVVATMYGHLKFGTVNEPSYAD